MLFTPSRGLADKLYALKAITSNVANNAKVKCSYLLKIANYEQNDAFVKFNYKKDRLDNFISSISTTNDFKDIWHICKIIFVWLHGQSQVKGGLSVNKEILQDNLQKMYLISQRLKYDTIRSTAQKFHDFVISPALYGSCKSAYLNYKIALDKVEDKTKTKSC